LIKAIAVRIVIPAVLGAAIGAASYLAGIPLWTTMIVVVILGGVIGWTSPIRWKR
jgi:hypothetical protein